MKVTFISSHPDGGLSTLVASTAHVLSKNEGATTNVLVRDFTDDFALCKLLLSDMTQIDDNPSLIDFYSKKGVRPEKVVMPTRIDYVSLCVLHKKDQISMVKKEQVKSFSSKDILFTKEIGGYAELILDDLNPLYSKIDGIHLFPSLCSSHTLIAGLNEKISNREEAINGLIDCLSLAFAPQLPSPLNATWVTCKSIRNLKPEANIGIPDKLVDVPYSPIIEMSKAPGKLPTEKPLVDVVSPVVDAYSKVASFIVKEAKGESRK